MTKANDIIYYSHESIGFERRTFVRRSLAGTLICGILICGAMLVSGSKAIASTESDTSSVLASATSGTRVCPDLVDLMCPRSDWPW
jgi:hypothetical protein